MADFVYSAISLGTFTDLDPSDGGNTKSEQAGKLVGVTFGSSTSPLYADVTDITFSDTSGDGTVQEDLRADEGLSYAGSAPGNTLDSTITYSVTINYTNGTSVSGVTVTVVQDTSGNLFLVGDGTDELDNGGIESITFDAIVEDDFPGFTPGPGRTNFLCFAAGTLIETPDGSKPVEALRAGDLVVTRDNGVQPLAWVGSFSTEAKGDLAPVVISAGTFDNVNDLVLSPQHRVLVTGLQIELMFGVEEALVPVVSLLNGDTIYRRSGGQITYHHVMCAGHEILKSDGVWSESLYVGPQSIHTLSDAQLKEISALFPDLLGSAAQPNAKMAPARPMLKRWEGALLRDAALI